MLDPVACGCVTGTDTTFVTVRDVQLVSVGTYHGIPLTARVLRTLADKYDPAYHEGQLSLGHPKDDVPAIHGAIGRVWFSNPYLMADLVRVPACLADEMKAAGARKYRSIEMTMDWAADPPEPTYLSGCSFLGTKVPACRGLQVIRDDQIVGGAAKFSDGRVARLVVDMDDHAALMARSDAVLEASRVYLAECADERRNAKEGDAMGSCCLSADNLVRLAENAGVSVSEYEEAVKLANQGNYAPTTFTAKCGVRLTGQQCGIAESMGLTPEQLAEGHLRDALEEVRADRRRKAREAEEAAQPKLSAWQMKLASEHRAPAAAVVEAYKRARLAKTSEPAVLIAACGVGLSERQVQLSERLGVDTEITAHGMISYELARLGYRSVYG